MHSSSHRSFLKIPMNEFWVITQTRAICARKFPPGMNLPTSILPTLRQTAIGKKIVTWNDVIWPSITWAFARGCYSNRRGIRKFSSSHWARSFGAKEYYYIQDEAVWGNETTRQVCDQTVMLLEIPLFVYWFVLYTFSDLLMEAFVSQSRSGVPLFLIQECPIRQN